jgi:hypothetical protein
MTELDDDIDRARSTNMLEIARRYVALKKIAVNEYAGPCPRCGRTDRFSVNPRKQLFFCRHCDAKGKGAIDLVMFLDGVDFWAALERLDGERNFAPVKPRAPDRVGKEEDSERNSRMALAIWGSAGSIRGTIAERYLTDPEIRNVDIDQIPELDDLLRFEANCPFDGANRAPCMVALVREILTNEPRAIQRVALTPDGKKIDRRSLGPTKGCAIKLWADSEVTIGLVVGEGLETVAGAATRIEHQGTLLQPAWALINDGGLGGFPVLAGVETLTILVDNDNAGLRAVDAVETRWLEAGRDVVRFTPNESGLDFSDIVRRRAAQ